jgi:hypothetical protein
MFCYGWRCMVQACLQSRPDKPRLNRFARRPRHSGCQCAAVCPREVACARPGRAVRLAPINAVAGPTRSNAKPTTSEPTVPSPTDAYPRPRHDAPRETTGSAGGVLAAAVGLAARGGVRSRRSHRCVGGSSGDRPPLGQLA